MYTVPTPEQTHLVRQPVLPIITKIPSKVDRISNKTTVKITKMTERSKKIKKKRKLDLKKGVGKRNKE